MINIRNQSQLRALLLKRVKGDTVEMNAADWREIREEFLRQLKKPKARKLPVIKGRKRP
jgi:hypothetical protein